MIASFKLRRHDGHVWVMPAGAATGVTLRGAEAERAFVLGAPLFALACPQSPQRVRALSVDLEKMRLLATLEAEPKPVPVRVDGDTVRDALPEALLEHLVAHSETRGAS